MGFLSGLTSILKPIAKVGSFIPGPWQGPSLIASGLMGVTDQLGAAAGVGSLAQGRSLNREALGAAREGMDFARQRQAQTAPFRELAMRDLLGATPEAPDLSAGFVDPTNPFSSASPRLALSLEALKRNA